MNTTTPAETVTIGRTTYTVERELTEREVITTLGWLRGPRGAIAAIVRNNRTRRLSVVARPQSSIGRMPADKVHAALAPLFPEAQ
jgi:hypothetical protein